MAIEREPPKAPVSPSKPSATKVASTLQNVHNSLEPTNPPAFGQTSMMLSPLTQRKTTNPFIMPRNKQRPEHHRPGPPPDPSGLSTVNGSCAPTNNFCHPYATTQAVPSQHTAKNGTPEFYEIPRPTNPPIRAIHARPAATFSSGVRSFAPINTSTGDLIDLTGTGGGTYTNDLFFAEGEEGGYVDAALAEKNIKALLEGAFEDEDDLPKRRGKKSSKKLKEQVELLAGGLENMSVKPEVQAKLGVSDAQPEKEELEEAGEEEDVDDSNIEGLKVRLLPHQIDGVEWMKEKELGTANKRRKGAPPKGGILADDMGLGKTIQSIALLLSNPRPHLSISAAKDDEAKEGLTSTVGKGTLVVAPLALIKQWEAEIESRVEEGFKLRVKVHHGPSRAKRSQDLQKYDVVITTYQTLTSEHSSSGANTRLGCMGLHWYRIILDEAHSIKNPKAKATQACCALNAEYRWCLTGTPMQNNLDELQSLIKFLKIKPYDEVANWKDQIIRPMNNGRGGLAMKRLQVFLKACMKRRTKDVLKKDGGLGAANGEGNAGFKIVDRKVEEVAMVFSEQEQQMYSRLEQRVDESIAKMIKGKMNYATALVLLLRLRQTCDHPSLVKKAVGEDKDALTTGKGSALQTPSKKKMLDNDMDDIAGILGGMSMQTKQCNVCGADLSEEEVEMCRSLPTKYCTACKELGELDDAPGAKRKESKYDKHNKHDKHDKHRQHKERKDRDQLQEPASSQMSVRPRNRPVVASDSEGEGEWLVPDSQQSMPGLSRAGDADDEDAEGGGEDLGSEDSEDSNEGVQIAPRRGVRKEVVCLDSDNEPDLRLDLETEHEISRHELIASEDDKDSDDSMSTSESDSDSATGASPDGPIRNHHLATSQPTVIPSIKIKHLLEILDAESAVHKFIVFSQFTAMLDVIEPFLHTHQIKFARYDGSMKNDLREASLQSLRTDPSTRILLCSLKCGSLGLNLTAASRVVLLEPFWNPFVEEQAIDRVHRLNQTVDVVVYRFVIHGSVEERILELQERKRKLAKAALEGGQAVAKLSMQDILALFKRDAEHDNRHETDHASDDFAGRASGLLGQKAESGGRASPEKYEGFSQKGRMATGHNDIVMPRIGGTKKKPAKRLDEGSIYGRRW